MADTVLLDDGGLKITAFQVNHEPVYPAVGYRFDYKGRSVVRSAGQTWSHTPQMPMSLSTRPKAKTPGGFSCKRFAATVRTNSPRS